MRWICHDMRACRCICHDILDILSEAPLLVITCACLYRDVHARTACWCYRCWLKECLLMRCSMRWCLHHTATHCHTLQRTATARRRHAQSRRALWKWLVESLGAKCQSPHLRSPSLHRSLDRQRVWSASWWHSWLHRQRVWSLPLLPFQPIAKHLGQPLSRRSLSLSHTHTQAHTHAFLPCTHTYTCKRERLKGLKRERVTAALLGACACMSV